MKRVKLLFSLACLLAVLGSGMSATVLPWRAQALPPECRCRIGGDYYYENGIAGDCQWLCED